MGLPYGENFTILFLAFLRYWQLNGRKSPIFSTVTLKPRSRGHSWSLILVPKESACTHSY